MQSFEYVLDKINSAPVNTYPFSHIHIDNLFAPEDFEMIVRSKEIAINVSRSDEELFNNLFNRGYRILNFPGCIESQKEYIRWHKSKKLSRKTNTACEGFGIALRLVRAETKLIRDLMQFLESKKFIQCLATKFNIEIDECTYDHGIQKYLDGYEITPHPDVRRKALTYMVNINTGDDSERREHHTHYLRFKPEWGYVGEFWKGNSGLDTCWVPWHWCTTEKVQSQNNSIVVFSPKNDTLHGIKADYDHLTHQRTQPYVNLWYNQHAMLEKAGWEDLVVPSPAVRFSLKNIAKRTFLKDTISKFIRSRRNKVRESLIYSSHLR